MSGLELRSLRKKFKINQDDLANELGLSRKTIIEYEKLDKIPDNKEALIVRFFTKFVTSDPSSYKLDNSGVLGAILSEEEPEIIINKNGAVYEPLDGGEYRITVDLVPFEAHARYISDDVQEYGEWERVSFIVDRVGRGNYKGFRHKGDSMFNEDLPSFYDTPNGAMSLCRELGRQHWKDGFNPKGSEYGWVIITNKNILHKDIIALNTDTGDITCHSRNTSPEYSDFTINLNEVKQIFKIIKRTL